VFISHACDPRASVRREPDQLLHAREKQSLLRRQRQAPRFGDRDELSKVPLPPDIIVVTL
jgi:hypothetical protein